jgi:hypothetical protein
MPARTHGHARHGRVTPEYNAWVKMWQRCTNPRDRKYPLYGGRGLTVCKRWQSYKCFLADVGPRPSPKYSLGRKNNARGYTPSNVRWETATEQNGNRRTWSRAIRYNGMTVAEAALAEGVSKQTIYRRVFGAGWGKGAP